MQSPHTPLALFLVLPLAVAGCGGSQPSSSSLPTPVGPTPTFVAMGTVSAGQKPMAGADVYLFSPSTAGYGQGATSLLDATLTNTSDSTGAYVTTDAKGAFAIPASTACVPGSPIYVLAKGGDSGSGKNNSATFMAVASNCSNGGAVLTSATAMRVNEVTTVAIAFATAAFATDSTHISTSGSNLAKLGLAHAFANAGNIASVSTGAALDFIAGGAATAPQQRVNTLANALAYCDLSIPGSASCTKTFAAAPNTAGTLPTDTANAAINIAHNPTAKPADIYALASSGPFSPVVIQAPSDFVLGFGFTAVSGLQGTGRPAIDADGSVWLVSNFGKSITKVTTNGVIASGASGFAPVSTYTYNDLALDDSGNAWVASSASGGSVLKLSNTGAVLSGNGFIVSGLTYPRGIALDGNGNAWLTSSSSIVKISPTGTVLSGTGGFTAPGFSRGYKIAVDAANNVWASTLTGYEVVYKFSNSGTLLSTPSGYSAPGTEDASCFAFDASGNAWTTGPGNDLVQIASTGLPKQDIFVDGPEGVAVDGVGNIWASAISDTAIRGYTPAGTTFTGTFGYNGGVLLNPEYLAIDGSGNLWVSDDTGGLPGAGSLQELLGIAAPVVTPLASAQKTNALGQRP